MKQRLRSNKLPRKSNPKLLQGKQPQKTTVQTSYEAEVLSGFEAVNDSGASRWRHAFEAALFQNLKEYEGQYETVRNNMEAGMRQFFRTPYREELSGIGKTDKKDVLSVEEAQRVIFLPRLTDMHRYVAAFSLDIPTATARSSGSGSSSRRNQLMRFELMSVLSTLHRKDDSLMILAATILSWYSCSMSGRSPRTGQQ